MFLFFIFDIFQDFVRRILHSHLRMASNSIEEDDEIESEAHTAQERYVQQISRC